MQVFKPQEVILVFCTRKRSDSHPSDTLRKGSGCREIGPMVSAFKKMNEGKNGSLYKAIRNQQHAALIMTATAVGYA